MFNFSSEEIRRNYLKTVEFRKPDWIPCSVGLSIASWYKYREKLEKIVLRHPKIFPFYRAGSIDYNRILGVRRRGNIIIDRWGCKWYFKVDGLQGQVVEHPLKDWSRLKDFSLPDADEGVPHEGYNIVYWSEIEKYVDETRKSGGLVKISMGHGFFFQRLYYLRGYSNLLKDFIKKPWQIYFLIDLISDFYMELVKRAVSLKPDVIVFGDDLGNQYRMPIRPETFREFIYPTYRKLFQYIRSHGIHVYFHSDGHVIEVLDQIIDSGANILNIQDKVNGIVNIRKICKGKVCIDLDFDRQQLLPYGSPDEIERHLKYSIRQLGSINGGLMMEAWIGPEVSLKNIDVICSMYEKYMTYHKFLAYLETIQ